MREKARDEKCVQEVKGNCNALRKYFYAHLNMLCNIQIFISEFSECCKDNSYLMVVKCRKQNSVLLECLTKWYQDEKFKGECTQEYLQERSEYRRTGIPMEKKGRIKVQSA